MNRPIVAGDVLDGEGFKPRFLRVSCYDLEIHFLLL